MRAVNELVQHEKYGFGTVVEQTPDTVTVAFFGQAGPMRFPYPGAFAGELQFAEPMAQREIAYELERRADPAPAPAAKFDF